MANILFIHGALGTALDFQDIGFELMQDHHECGPVHLPGHTDKSIVNWENLLDGTVAQRAIFFGTKPVHIVGYSLGGYLSLYLQSQGKINAKSLAVINTKCLWDNSVLEKQLRQLDFDILKEKAPDFLSNLQRMNPDKMVRTTLTETQELLSDITKNLYLDKETLSKISVPTMIWRGSRDIFVTEADANFLHKNINHSEIELLENESHLLKTMNMKKLAEKISNWVIKNENG